MKKILLILTCVFFLSACTEDTSEGVSSVTNYPNLNFIGERIIVLQTGDDFTDPGATADAGGEPLELTTTGAGDVDTSTPGVYKIDYSAINEDGFPAGITRTVIVLDSAPSAINLEGTFFRNGNPNNVVRLADRVYRCDNAGGLNPADPSFAGDFLELTFYNLDDERVYAPFQVGSESGITVESSIGTIYDNNHWDWVLFASGVYGTAVRDFTR